MSKAQRVNAFLEDLDCAIRQLPGEFTVADVAARTRWPHSPQEIATILRKKALAGRLLQTSSRKGNVGQARYQRIPGVSLTSHLPKGLVVQAVWVVFSENRQRTWTFPELVRWVASYTGRSAEKVRQAINRILRVWAANDKIELIGKRGTGRSAYRYQYRLRADVHERPLVSIA